MNQSVDRLVARIKRLEDAQRKANRTPQLIRSSIDNGAVNVYDGTGQLTGVVGQQFDGASGYVAVSGPTPPQPSQLILEPVLGGIRVTWDGTFVGGAVTPTDFSRVEIHVSEDPGLSGLLRDTLRGSIESPRGGDVLVPYAPGVPLYARAVARSTAGKPSTASTVAGPVQVALITADDVDTDIGGNTIYRGPDTPTGALRVGDLWLRTPDNIVFRWEGDPPEWTDARDQGIAQAINDAFEAHNLAASKTVTIRQPTEPAATGRTIGDLWINTSPGAGNLASVWDGDSWEPSPIGAGALDAIVGGSNLLSDSSMQHDPAEPPGFSAFTYWDGVGVWDPATTYRGYPSFKVTTDASGHNQGFAHVVEPGLTFDPGTVLRAGCVVKGPAGYSVSISVRYLLPNGSYLAESGGAKTYTLTGGWDWIVSDPAPQDFVSQTYRPGIQVVTWQNDGTTAPVAGVDFWFTQSQLVVGDVMPAWSPKTDEVLPGTIVNESIQPNSLVASDVIATGTVTAALLESVLVLTNRLVAGSPTGARIDIQDVGITQVEADGSVTFQLQPGGSTYFAGVLSGRSNNYASDPADPAARQGWIIDEDGDAAFQTVQVFDTLSAASVSASNIDIAGVSVQQLIDVKPRGLVAAGFDNTVVRLGVDAEIGVVELGFHAYPGRSYQVHIKGGVLATALNDWYSFQLRYTNNGDAPTVNSEFVTLLGDMTNPPDNGGTEWAFKQLNYIYLFYPTVTAPAGQPIRLLLSMRRVRGASSQPGSIDNTGTQLDMWIEDIGPIMANSIRPNASSNAAPPPPPPAPVQTYTETFYATGGASYRADGSRWSVNEQGWAYQGNGDSFNGNQMSMHFFDTNYIRSRIGSGTVKSATFYAHNGHTWNYSGGTLVFGTHNWATMPATKPGTGLVPNRGQVAHAKGAWVAVDGVIWLINEIVANTTQGVIFGPAPDNNNAWYSYWYQYPHADLPRIVVTWEV